MEVVCPKCNALYKIPDHKVPPQNAVLTCKRCSHRITVKPLFQSDNARQVPAETEAKAIQPIAPKAMDKPVTAHANEILQSFSQVSTYNAQQYDMSEILVPTKKGQYKTSANKLKMKLLDAVKPVMDSILETDERITRLAPATAYYPWEIILGNGWLTLLYNRYVLVATNKRLVAVNTNARMNKATHYIFQFPYGSIKKVTRGMFGTNLILTRKQAKRRIFNGIKRSLAARMKDWIATRIHPQQPVDSPADLCEHVCPACYVPLGEKLSACQVCGVAFKSPQKAALRSLLLPGLGDIYLGHRFLGAIELIGALFVWSMVLTMFLSGQSENMIVGLVLLLFVNGMDALLTLHMGKKGYALDKKQKQAIGHLPGTVRTSVA